MAKCSTCDDRYPNTCEPCKERLREEQQAMVFLGTYGSTTFPPKKWKNWQMAERGYCPEFLEHDEGLNMGKAHEPARQALDPDSCVTVLHNINSYWAVPKGFSVAFAYYAGERECPDCGPGTDNERNRSQCQLCEGDGLIYWGEEFKVIVFERRKKQSRKELKRVIKGLLKEKRLSKQKRYTNGRIRAYR